MFDIWWGNIELTMFTLIVSFALLLPLQLLLCFKVKRCILRLLPVIFLSVLAILFLFLSLITPAWENMVYLCLAIFAVFMTFICGVGWSIWWITTHRK